MRGREERRGGEGGGREGKMTYGVHSIRTS